MTQYQAKIYFAHWLNVEKLIFPFQVEIHNVFVRDTINLNAYNILVLSNEPEITRMKNSEVLRLANQFNLVLTWDKFLLEQLPNAKFFPMGMTWIRKEDYESIDINEKKFKISFVCGTKNMTYNHQLRHKLWNKFYDIHANNVYFFNSSHNPMGTHYNYFIGPNPEDKTGVLKDFQFHIAIENTNYENYFSEKLIDCFVTKTIPIYCGCINLGNFFNMKGVIPFRNDNVNDIIEICNHLTPTYYLNHLKYVEENYLLAQEYARDFSDRLYEVIMEYIERK